MLNEFSRTQMILGEKAMETLRLSKVAVFGVGGVGSFTVEALARCGIEGLTIFDDDVICLSNINRQLIATHKTLGQKKVEVMKNRILDINPNCNVNPEACFYSSENADHIDLSHYDYIVDAIDTVSSKLLLIERAHSLGVPIISAMGAGNKLDPTRFEVADIYETSICPLAKVMRKELRARGIPSLKVVYSKEEAIKPTIDENSIEENCNPDPTRRTGKGKRTPGSISFVPSVAGLILASQVVKDLIQPKTER
ncbi:MAG: tRNA threonylcarbamoyladenosine dehydratase [Anaerovoracaceae bacterium]|jgi:tRNA A37 threonylcarbamoyladenosine dehydratase